MQANYGNSTNYIQHTQVTLKNIIIIIIIITIIIRDNKTINQYRNGVIRTGARMVCVYHVTAMGNKKNVNTALVGNNEGKRTFGRTRRKWNY
jgi:hypothetical protein